MRKRKGRRNKCLREHPKKKKAASGNCFSTGTRFIHGLGYHILSKRCSPFKKLRPSNQQIDKESLSVFRFYKI